MGLGDFLGDLATTAVENLPAIVSAVRGPTSPQAMSFAPLAQGTQLQRGIENILGLQPAGTGVPALTGLPAGYNPMLFKPAATARGATPRRRIELERGGRIFAWQYLGRPILYSGDRQVARRWMRVTGFNRGRRGTRRRRPR